VSSKQKEPIRLRWEGAQFVWHSLAHVNREFCHALLDTGRTEISLWPTEDPQFGADDYPRFHQLHSRVYSPLSGLAHAHIRHHFPPRFEQPDEGYFVLIQPWEYGFLPLRWIEPIEKRVHEVWCYSKYVRDVYVASGISPDKLHVAPLGVDTKVFNPEAPPYIVTIEPGADRVRESIGERFVFLYVGGTLHRKGADILLDAYLKAFSAYDDVCLLVKDTGTKTVYYGQNERERILALASDNSRPPIVYIEDDLSAHQLAGLYTAAHCLVQPYRGEGFCLPALEAMAAGIPVLVPAGGPD